MRYALNVNFKIIIQISSKQEKSSRNEYESKFNIRRKKTGMLVLQFRLQHIHSVPYTMYMFFTKP